MTTTPKARRFRLKLGDDLANALRTHVAPQDRAATPPQPPQASAPRTADEGVPRRPTASAPPSPASASAPPAPRTALADEHSADTTGSPRAEAEIEAIRDEGLTGRQLRMAMRVAQRNGIKATTGIDAVRLLREKGIDPFERSTLLDLLRDEPGPPAVPADAPPLPRTQRATTHPLARIEPAQVPAPAQPGGGVPGPAQRQAEIGRIQKDIVKRRQRRMVLLAARLGVFVFLPTFLAAWYFFVVATPLYATHAQFVVQQAGGQSVTSSSGIGSMFAGAGLGGGGNDNTVVQGYLISREAMHRLDAAEGFKSYFQQDFIDPLLRLPPDATDEAAFRLYEDMVRVSYDPTEGTINMEVIAADPATSERFARVLVGFAEERVDQITQRPREDSMREAMASVAEAEARFAESQLRLLEVQERSQMLSSEVEVSLLTQQIANLETQLNNERLGLADLRSNARPNAARLEQAERRVLALETQIADLRDSLTRGGEDGMSVARLQREQVLAQSEVATRQMLLTQAMQQLEAARVEANRQVRYLSLGVSPVAPDEPSYPRAFANTALAFLIFAGIYLLVSMTSAILREQITG